MDISNHSPLILRLGDEERNENYLIYVSMKNTILLILFFFILFLIIIIIENKINLNKKVYP